MSVGLTVTSLRFRIDLLVASVPPVATILPGSDNSLESRRTITQEAVLTSKNPKEFQ